MNTSINTSTLIQNQLLATKFSVPVTSDPLISRPRLSTLLGASLKHPLTLVSAPAGFGKTTLLATWGRSRLVHNHTTFSGIDKEVQGAIFPKPFRGAALANHPRLCWVSLDEKDNDPRLFWTYVLAALDAQQSQRFVPLVTLLQSPQGPLLKNILAVLINVLAENTEHFLLILDDYHLITEQQVHTTLLYLVEHLPAQLRIILITRTDPPLPLSQLRAHRQVVEVRTDQLRCTVEETRTFFQQVIGTQFPEEIIQEVTTRTEGWLAGLQLLGLSLPEQANPATLLQEVSGDQRYILDYLIEEVLRRQSQEVQVFLLSTCILERLNASLCDTVIEQDGSQQMLQKLEQANLFVVSLDSRREWYRYHTLFAEALYHQLKQMHADLVPLLHSRASLWYAEHDQTTEAILHALKACEWQWTADLIERKSRALNALSWGVSHYHLFLLRDWLMQIPADVVSSRPCLCLARIWMVLFITPHTVLETWLNAVEATLTAALTQSHQESAPSMRVPQAQQEQENMLGEAITYRALLQSHSESGEATLPLCQRAQALLSADNVGAHAHIAVTRLITSYASSVNDAAAAIQIGLQAGSLNQTTDNTDQAISIMGLTSMHMIGTGRLHETQQLAQQAILLGKKPDACVLPAVGWPMVWHAEVLRQRNELDVAHSCIEEAIKLLAQLEWTLSPLYALLGYAILLRISLSCGELDAASSALQEVERIGMNMPQPSYSFFCSHFTTLDQVRLWLAHGELDRAMHWAEELDLKEQHGTPFAREREEAARACVLLARKLPHLALQRLEPALQRATAGKRWGHVIEIQLLQALAYQMLQQETQALETLSEAVRLAEPEGYIRSFVDEGPPMAALLSRLREQQRKAGPIPYLDKLLSAFPQQSKAQERQPKRAGERTKTLQLVDPLSEREQEVLQLLARGSSNQEIAQELVIAYDTVKRHVSHVFSKLGVNNRVQAVRQARELSLLDEES